MHNVPTKRPQRTQQLRRGYSQCEWTSVQNTIAVLTIINIESIHNIDDIHVKANIKNQVLNQEAYTTTFSKREVAQILHLVIFI